MPSQRKQLAGTDPLATRARSRRYRNSRVAALPNLEEQDRLEELADRRARDRLEAAREAGDPLVDPMGRQRSPVTLPEYRLGRAPANKGRRFPAEPLTGAEVVALVEALPTRGAAAARDRALIMVLYRAGLRVAEALALRCEHIDLEQGAVTVLLGKGAKRRVAGIDPTARPYLEAWLQERHRLAVGAAAPLFCTVRTVNGARPGGAMNPSRVRQMLKTYARKAGITKRVHPHGLRHTCAYEMAQEGIPVIYIQQQLGHDDLGMTDHYIRHLAPQELLERVTARAPAIAPAAARPGPETTTGRSPTPAPRRPSTAPELSAAAAEKATNARGPADNLLDVIRANGGSVTQAQLRHATGLSVPALLKKLNRLHEEGKIMRGGMDQAHRSVIWKVAPPRIAVRRTTPYRQAPRGEGPRRVLDGLEAFGGRASQTELARALDLAVGTVHSHCLELQAAGQIQPGGLDKSTSNRGSRIWKIVPAPTRYSSGGGYTRTFVVPRCQRSLPANQPTPEERPFDHSWRP